MDKIKFTWEYTDEELEELDKEREAERKSFSPLPHGWIVDVSFRPYHSAYVYEDGYVELESIGD